MYLNGMGVTTIQYELEKAGQLTALEKERWFASYISKMLRNSFYSGIITYHKEYTPDFLKQKKIKNYGDLEYEDEIVITYNFTDSPERLKVNKEQILQEEKQTKRAKHSFSFNSGSTILAGSTNKKELSEHCRFKRRYSDSFYFTERRRLSSLLLHRLILFDKTKRLFGHIADRYAAITGKRTFKSVVYSVFPI